MTLVQSRILALFKRWGAMTDSRLIEVWTKEHDRFPDSYPEVSESGLRTRRRELVDLGELKDSGMTAELPSGRKSILWCKRVESW